MAFRLLTEEEIAFDEAERERLRQLEPSEPQPHGMLGMRLEQSVDAPLVSMTVRLAVIVYDQESVGSPSFRGHELVDVPLDIRVVDSRGLELAVLAVRDSQGRYYVDYEVENPGMHTWSVGIAGVPGIHGSSSFQGRL
jgi:hypothetical protein